MRATSESLHVICCSFPFDRGMRVIAGGCPLMLGPTSDAGHEIMRSLLTVTGKVPRRV
jgi:uncharacterized protein